LGVGCRVTSVGCGLPLWVVAQFFPFPVPTSAYIYADKTTPNVNRELCLPVKKSQNNLIKKLCKNAYENTLQIAGDFISLKPSECRPILLQACTIRKTD
jgi:hypothetical protein